MENTDQPKSKKKKAPLFILAVVLVSAAAFGINKYIYSLHHEDTDDAQVDADISPVLSRVPGYVNEIRFEENQLVTKGDTLVMLDDRDLRVKLQQAQAAVDNAAAAILVAKANVATAQANAATSSSNTETAKVKVWKATQDFNRYQKLVSDQAITQQQFDAAKAEKLSADAQLESASRQQSSSSLQEQVSVQQVAVAQSVLAQRQADVDFAKLQLSYATITAPASGHASKKNIQNGQYVNAGTPLFAIVSGNGAFVVANFKETQLEKMKTGLPVEIHADAFPDETISGIVYSFSAATGAKFSLLPPDNATGNFVKVVQRIPVKIKINATKEIMDKLRAGMSVRVSVKVD
ncbi:MAG: HlyD family secretion protein [Bacteroidetes bacterium]|nr:HlyD family secretion protein [Bacteroidota bacterium]